MTAAEQAAADGDAEVRGVAAVVVGEAPGDWVPVPQGPVRAPVAAIRSRIGKGSLATFRPVPSAGQPWPGHSSGGRPWRPEP